MLNYFTLNTIAELVCLVVAFACLFNDKSVAWKSTIIYLLAVCVIEFSGIYIKLQGERNSWIYNLLLLFEIGYFSFMFHNLLKPYFNCRPLILSGLAVLSISYVNDLYNHGPNNRHNLTIIVLSVVIILYCLFYFYYLIKDDNYILIKYSAQFWWVAAVLFYYFVQSTVTIFYPALSRILVDPREVFSYVFKIINIVFYATWSYAFICRRWITLK
ncbi:MAG: hypothetical protein EOO89_21305 [Pedobacter sp.]|nr:MAG: hypothetical protein EOO89_21305 [Pedobacter sp.]